MHPCSTGVEAGKSELGGAVDGNKQPAFALCRCHLSNVDMKEANRILLKLLSFRFLALHIWQAADPMTLQAAVK